MRIKNNLLPALFVCALLALIFRVFSRPAAAKHDTTSISSTSPTYDAIDRYVEAQLRRLNIPGAVLAIVSDEQIVHLQGFGRARPDGEKPAPQTPFIIGSLTKSMTALAVMQLVEAGKVELDAPVQRYLPWFRVADPEAPAAITVRHLLNQTSGLSSASGWITLADFDNRPDATERQARALASLKLTHPVGAGFEYSNTNYNLLGLVIEAASGETYADYIQNHIFTPLKMNHSYTSQEAARQDNLAVGHQHWFFAPFAVPRLPAPQGSLPSGQVISSAEDMAHYMIAFLNEGRYEDAQILSRAGIAELHRGVAEDIQMGISLGRYGMGWYISETGGAQIAWHNGSCPDFASYMALIPGQKKGVVLLVNADHFMMVPALAEVGAGISALLAGEQPDPIEFGFIPWMMRSLLLIPLLQLIGVAATLRQVRRWRRDPTTRPTGPRRWASYILPLAPNLLAALMLIPLLGPMRGFWMLFMPDFSWTAILCGSFAVAWGFVRVGLERR